MNARDRSTVERARRRTSAEYPALETGILSSLVAEESEGGGGGTTRRRGPAGGKRSSTSVIPAGFHSTERRVSIPCGNHGGVYTHHLGARTGAARARPPVKVRSIPSTMRCWHGKPNALVLSTVY